MERKDPLTKSHHRTKPQRQEQRMQNRTRGKESIARCVMTKMCSFGNLWRQVREPWTRHNNFILYQLFVGRDFVWQGLIGNSFCESDGRYSILEMEADGNCLFRALSDQLFHDHGSRHAEIRSAVCDFIRKHEKEFSVFLVLDEEEEDEDAKDFKTYVINMMQDGEWGGNLELVAAARLFR